MPDQNLARQLAAVLTAEQEQRTGLGTVAGGMDSMESRLVDILITLRSMHINWLQILSLVGPIIALLQGGGSWQVVLADVLALFGITPTPPVPPVPAPPTPAPNP